MKYLLWETLDKMCRPYKEGVTCPTNWTSWVGTRMWALASWTSSTPTFTWWLPKGMLWMVVNPPHKVFQGQPGGEDFHRRIIHISLTHLCLGRAQRDQHNSPLCWHEQQKDQPQAKEAVRVPVISSAIEIGIASRWKTTLVVESLFLWSTPPVGP